MDLLGVTEISVEQRWKASAGEVKPKGKPRETSSLALSFSDLALSDFYDHYLMPSSKISAQATEWDPAKVLPIGLRTC